MSDYFSFGAYEYDREQQLCTFSYTSTKEGVTHHFTERLSLPKQSQRDNVPADLLDRVLSYLHLAIGTSYFKVFAPREVRLPAPLHPLEASFFKSLYTKGLGEFYYRNNLDINSAPSFPSDDQMESSSQRFGKKSEKILVGVGGGKDSVVAIELLKEAGYNPTLFVVETGETSPIVAAVSAATKLPILTVTRTIDPKLLNGIEGSYNGHIPKNHTLDRFLQAVPYLHFRVKKSPRWLPRERRR